MVVPNGNEQEFIDVALALDYDEIVFITGSMDYKKPASDKISVKTAFLLKNISQMGIAKKKFDYVIAPAERQFFEIKADFIVSLENDLKDNFHYRNTPLNQVHAALAKKSRAVMTFDFRVLLYNPILALGKMYQNAGLIKKYSLDNDSFSFARSPSEMRSRQILDALLRVLGL